MTNPSSPPPVSVSNLTRKYGSFTAVKDSTFTLTDGEVFGIVGPNGAGKTTTLKMIAGLLEPTSGTVEVFGGQPTNPQVRENIGFLPEDSPVYETMTPKSYLKFFADLFGVPDDIANQRIEDTLDKLHLEKRNTKLGDMSKGMRRKVAITRSLINDPDVLIYDEPASGLDPLTTNYIIEFTKSLADDGKTVIFSAHNLYHVEEICDRLLIMTQGEVVAKGTISDIRETYGTVSYNIFTDLDYNGAEKVSDGKYCLTCESHADAEVKQKQIREEGGTIIDVRTVEDSLEDIFLTIADNAGENV